MTLIIVSLTALNFQTTLKYKLTSSNWFITGHLPSNDLILTKTKKQSGYMIFNFKPDNKIVYLGELSVDCPVGDFTLKEGNWNLNGDFLTVEIKGLVIADYWYWYKVKYKIDHLSENQIKFKVIEVIKNREIKPTSTWEDLTKQ